jgi:AcrR family transcriptional regulator
VTQRTLFRHFRSKDAILFDDDSLVEFFDAALDRNLAVHAPIQAIRLTLLDMAASYDRNAALFRAHHEVISQSSMLRAFARQRTARIDDLVALGFEGHAAFRARTAQPNLNHRVAAAALIGAVRVITDEWLEGRIDGSMVDLSLRSWPALQIIVEGSLALPQ